MSELGNFSLMALLLLAIYAVAASLLGARSGRSARGESAERAVLLGALLATMSIACLAALLLSSDFSYRYVANYTNEALPIPYKIAALWAGHDGSLLLWLWLVVVFSALAVWQNRRRNRELMPYVVVVFGAVIIYFTYLSFWVANPFEQLGVMMSSGEARPFTPADGRGLNPLLQHPIMAIHPPVLYLGYVGFVVPFAFCVAALLRRKLDNQWIATTRRWTLFSWFFLGMGILLGARWAYVELGWGGYWAWDPVENASLMPWLMSTAYLHSVMIQERKGMLKVWNVVLILATYLLSILGTFLTRSGVVSSVHAFAESEFASRFLLFLGAVTVACAWLVFSRRSDLKSEHELDSLASREASFLFNNLLLLTACFAILWGTLFPVLSEAVSGEKISVGPAYFNRINIPILLGLLFLTGVGPLLAWRKTSLESLKRNFRWPALAGLAAALSLVARGVHDLYALICYVLCAFVVTTILQELARGIDAKRRNGERSRFRAGLDLLSTNTRRYGGYIVHFGIVLIFVGVGGAAFNEDVTADLAVSESARLGPYEIAFERYADGATANYDWMAAVVELRRDGRSLGSFEPEKRIYRASQQPTSEVRRYSTFREDVYFVFAGMTDSGKATIHVFRNPLVRWVWLGGLVVFVGGLTTMVPSRRELRAVVAERPRSPIPVPAPEEEVA